MSLVYKIKMVTNEHPFRSGIYCDRFSKKVVPSLTAYYKGKDDDYFYFESMVIAKYYDRITGEILEKYDLNSVYALPRTNEIKNYIFLTGVLYKLTNDKITKL